MAAKIEDAWTEVYNELVAAKAAGQPLAFVKNISQGIREDLAGYPLIVMEPDIEAEEQRTVPQHKNIAFTIKLSCIIEVIDKNRQIIGGAGNDNNTGILTFAAAVKNVLNQTKNLNGKCIKFDFPSTAYTFEAYPYRSAEISMRMELISADTQR
jgi:hypothetical protein